MFGLMLAVLFTLTPLAHGDFDHYTFALTWQPGICQTEDGCTPGQPHTPLIGLHGLWASLPADLSSRGVVDRQWWSRGCDYYHHSDDAPPVDAALDVKLEAVMPHFKNDLLVHEYDKHVQCFGFDATQFFTDELRMRDLVGVSSFGAYLVAHDSQTVAHADVVAAFARAFHTGNLPALQLQCERASDGRTVLTQFWITIHSAQLASFPAPQAFMATPVDQDTCPASFVIPSWP